MDEIIKNQFAVQDEKIDAIYTSVEKTRKYLLIIMWSSVIMVALPLLAMLLVVPALIRSFSSYTSGLTGF
ncbi:MAG: hypothetical protein R3B53_04725 [Candidatus Paceibacterota bacterium]